MKTKRPVIGLMAAMLMAVLALGCETREESIERENSYLAEYPVEEVAHYWDQVPWVTVDGVTLKMDVSAPEGEGPYPVLMIIHGGGWTLHTNTIMEGMARYITNRGYVVFNINYRTLPEGVELEQIFEDCLGALIWVKEHASEYKGDPNRIAVTGDSAGGHLSAMIVTSADDPAFTPTYQGDGSVDRSVTCAAPSYGVFDFSDKLTRGVLKQYLGESYQDNPERFDRLSPIKHIRPDLPPQLIIVGNEDPLHLQNENYVKALEKAGAPVEFWVFKGESHAFLNNYWEDKGTKGYDRIIEFLDKHLK